MLKLKSLRFSGIGRFVEPQDINFSELGNLIQVDAENRNTGGSSGAGKSTIFNALDYLFGINDLPTTVLKSRLTKEAISVHGEFDYDGKPLLITRNKLGLLIDLEGQVTTGSNALAEERLDQILGMSRDLFRKILHKRQKEGGFFLDFTPKKMYEFLTDALNLDAERKKLEKVEAKITELEKLKNTRQNSIISIQSSLKATQESVLALGLPPIKDIHQPVILELKGRYDVSTQRFKEVEEKHKVEAIEIEKERPSISVRAYDGTKKTYLDERSKTLVAESSAIARGETERISTVKTLINEKNLEQSKIINQITNGTVSKAHATKLATEIKKIRDSICPTCDQGWVTENAKTKESELLAELAKDKEAISLGLLAFERQQVLNDEIMILNGQLKPVVDPKLIEINEELDTVKVRLAEEKVLEIEHLSKENAKNTSILAEFVAKETKLTLDHKLELEQARGQKEVDGKAFDAAINKLKSYEEARKRYDSSLNIMKTMEADAEVKLVEEQSALSKVERSILVADELKKAIKTFLSISFDGALESIGEMATKNIRCIPNMSNATIQFEGQKETKEGKVKEEVNAVISMDGEIGIPIKSLSGGERSSIDLAVDLAVIDFIESETGKGIDVFILDEPFTGLDTVSIEMALELLKNLNTTKKLIVVDHNPEVKEMVSNRIVVIRDGESSTIAS